MKNNILVVALIIFVSLLPLKGEIDKEISTLKVSTVKVEGRDVLETVNLSGRVVANRKLAIKSPVDGIISKVHVIDGEWLSKDEKIVTYDTDMIREMIKQNLTDIGKWEKILKQRKNWKVREKKSENSAVEKIKSYKIELKKNKEFLKNPIVVSGVEGKVLRVVSEGEKVRSGSVIAVIVDNYVVKIPIPSSKRNYLFKGMRLDVKFPKKNLSRMGRVGLDNDKPVIFVNNSDLKIVSGMKAVYIATKKIRGAVLINKRDFNMDSDNNHYVYIVNGKRALKKRIKIRKYKDDNFFVTLGINIGDLLVSPAVETFSKKKIKKAKQDSFSLGKKMEYVISLGMSFVKPKNLILKNNGIDSSVSQYADSLGYDHKTEGKFKEKMMGIPISFIVNYKLSDGIYLKFGGEYETISNLSDKAYSVSWPSLTEKMDYSVKNSITNIMPFVGIEKRFSSFGVYAIIGLNLTSFKYENILDLNDGSYSLKKVTEIKASGTGIGFNIGAKYMIKLNKYGIIVKAEYAIRTISSFSGDKSYKATDSLGNKSGTEESGSLYIYDYDPYGKGGFEWWDIHKNSPNASNIKNVKDFSLNISSIRMMIGFTF